MKGYLYSVFDTDTNKTILTNVPIKEVAETIGLTKAHVSTYADKDYTYKKRYHITRHIEQKEKEPEYTPADRDFIKRWNSMLKAVKVIKEGGHITTKLVNGKWVKYTKRG